MRYMNNKNDYFFCYSPRLKDRFLDEGERYICVGLNEHTRKKFWLFENTASLNRILDDWRAEKIEMNS